MARFTAWTSYGECSLLGSPQRSCWRYPRTFAQDLVRQHPEPISAAAKASKIHMAEYILAMQDDRTSFERASNYGREFMLERYDTRIVTSSVADLLDRVRA